MSPKLHDAGRLQFAVQLELVSRLERGAALLKRPGLEINKHPRRQIRAVVDPFAGDYGFRDLDPFGGMRDSWRGGPRNGSCKSEFHSCRSGH
jgi:hypothetical protein